MKRMSLMFFFFMLLFSMVAFSFNASGANPSALNLKKAIYNADENTLILEGANIDQVEPLSVTIGSEILTLCLAGQFEACCEVTAQRAIMCGLDGTPINGGGTYSVTVQQGQGSPGIASIDVYIPPLPPPVCLPGDFVECYTGSPSEIGVGPCTKGIRSCLSGTWDTECSGEITPVAETCNEVDDDCDGEVDEDFDNDLDGYSTCAGDCDDDPVTGPAVYPGATEFCDGIDNDCDPLTADGSGEPWAYSGCDGPDADLCNENIWHCDGGVQICYDFTDDSVEVCNGYDDDCDGSTDEGVLSTFYHDGDSDGYGDPLETTTGCFAPPGYLENSGDCDDTEASINPEGTEICNGLDDDCDGHADNLIPPCGSVL